MVCSMRTVYEYHGEIVRLFGRGRIHSYNCCLFLLQRKRLIMIFASALNAFIIGGKSRRNLFALRRNLLDIHNKMTSCSPFVVHLNFLNGILWPIKLLN